MSVSVMKKLTVLTHREHAEPLLRRLVKLRCVEVRSVDRSDESLHLQKLRADQELERCEALLKDIREALPVLVEYSNEKHGIGRSLRAFDGEKFCSDGGRARGIRTVEETLLLLRRREELEQEEAQIRWQMDALMPWQELDLPMEQTETARTKTLLGCCPPSVKLDALQGALEELNAFSETVFSDKHGVYLTVTCLKDVENQVRSRLGFRIFAGRPAARRGDGTAEDRGAGASAGRAGDAAAGLGGARTGSGRGAGDGGDPSRRHRHRPNGGRAAPKAGLHRHLRGFGGVDPRVCGGGGEADLGAHGMRLRDAGAKG